MKASILCSATLFTLATFAFPANLLKGDISEATLAEITSLTEKITRDLEIKRRSGHEKRAFNAEAQRISTTGDHSYIAPGSNDLRGPCPGLNAMANHGYLPRNGISTITQMTTAANEVFGMGLDLSAFLSIYSAIVAGDLTSFSIGGKPKTGGLLGGLTSSLGLLGEPQGLSASHNRFEHDGSPLRADLYSTGDPVSLNLRQFEELLSMPLSPNGIDASVMTAFRINRVRHSIATNGHYFAGPVTFFALNPATYQFTYRFFANHTAENPEGYLDAKTLMSFEGVTGEKGNYKWSRGQERIPENWYRRFVGDEYTIAAFTSEAIGIELANPELIRLGGNTGEPNTFTGVNIDDLTGNVFNAQTLLEGNNIMCLAYVAALQATPDLLGGLVGNVLVAVQKLTNALDPIIAALGCPEVTKYDATVFKAFPGAGSAL
ncbi:Chloroperoxidase [Phaeosphaeria sp. MPI-PUGE-AT-0046c]|nr:Chloroperoxidase [Phaeosphaeria sp. MPI-PUGE-AT-0046c]